MEALLFRRVAASWSGERTRLACWRWRPRHRELHSRRWKIVSARRRNQHARARALPRFLIVLPGWPRL